MDGGCGVSLVVPVGAVVEDAGCGRTKAVTKLYRNGKLAAVRTITAEGTTYAFKGDN